jgi:hypothetical protein
MAKIFLHFFVGWIRIQDGKNDPDRPAPGRAGAGAGAGAEFVWFNSTIFLQKNKIKIYRFKFFPMLDPDPH